MRIALVPVIALALVIGCKSQTPEQKAQAKLEKQQAAETKKAQKQAAADAKAAEKRAAEQAKADKKAAQKEAKELKKQKPEQVRHTAMADADYYPDDKLKVVGYPDIKPENEPKWIDKHAQAMAGAGAAEEATLYEGDFLGTDLSAMGRSRLRLMMQDPPPTIYVAATGGEAQKQARFAAVTKFWQEATAQQIALKEGVNDSLTSPANAGLSALERMDKQRAGSNRSAIPEAGGSRSSSPSEMPSSSNP